MNLYVYVYICIRIGWVTFSKKTGPRTQCAPSSTHHTATATAPATTYPPAPRGRNAPWRRDQSACPSRRRRRRTSPGSCTRCPGWASAPSAPRRWCGRRPGFWCHGGFGAMVVCGGSINAVGGGSVGWLVVVDGSITSMVMPSLPPFPPNPTVEPANTSRLASVRFPPFLDHSEPYKQRYTHT